MTGKDRKPIFVIQKHQASRLHFDFRIEMDGVLKSWAMPKRPSGKIGKKNLAIQVEDHELDYANFEGEIAVGEYGTGYVKIWDKGEYELLSKLRNHLKLRLFGIKLKGNYVLFKFPQAGKNAWLFFKIRSNRVRESVL